ncbi:MAG: TRAP transporter substrate-binding protein [Burkholderiaceae bacterium]
MDQPRTMRMLRALALTASVCALGLTSGAQALAADMKVGLMLKKDFPGAEPVNGMYEMFKQEVEAASGGKISVDIVYGGALGKPNERLNQVRQGIIQMSDASDGNYASIYKDIQVLSMPFAFKDEAAALSVLDGPIGQRIADGLLAKTGIRVLGWWESGGFKHYSANAPIQEPADMKGKKIRVLAPIFGLPVQALGGSPATIAFPELYAALKTGVVDGQDNAVWVFNLVKLYEVQKYLMLSGHIYSFGPLAVNDQWYQSLAPDLRQAVDAAAAKAIAFNRKSSREVEAAAIAAAREHGVTVVPFDAPTKARWAEAVRPAAVEWLKANVDTPELVDELIAAAAKANAAR